MSSGRRRRALISLTPLIDVVFILLVFFMLASSFVDWRAIDLNTQVRAASGAAGPAALLVELGPDGSRLLGEPVDLVRLTTRIREQWPHEGDPRVLVKPGPGVSLQDTVRVLDRLAASGIVDLTLVRDMER